MNTNNEYPEYLKSFINTKNDFFRYPNDGYGETPCSKLAKETIKDKNDRETFVDMIYQNAYNIFDKVREMGKNIEKQPN